MTKSGTWNQSETKELKRLWSEGNDIYEIAKALERKSSSIRGKLLREGMIHGAYAENTISDVLNSKKRQPTDLYPRLLLAISTTLVFVFSLIFSSDVIFVVASGIAVLSTVWISAIQLGGGGKRDFRWTPENVDILKTLSDEGQSLDYIALKLDRTVPSIRSKLVQLGEYSSYKNNAYEKSRQNFEELSRKTGKRPELNSRLKALEDPKFILRLIENHESKTVELKQTFATDSHTKEISIREKHSVVKTVCGFLNANGGRLIIGVTDSKKVVGIFDDNYKDDDKYILKIEQTLRSALSQRDATSNIHTVITRMPGSESVCVIDVDPSVSPILCCHREWNEDSKQKNTKYPKDHEIFYLRENRETISLNFSEAQRYIARHFENTG